MALFKDLAAQMVLASAAGRHRRYRGRRRRQLRLVSV